MSVPDRFSMSRTFLLGFGFLGVSIIWSMYNAYVPVFLKQSFGLPSTVIGLIMTIDNVLAIVVLPFLGALSDRTRSRLGRRRPYILAGSFMAAIFFILVPFANDTRSLSLMMGTIVLMNLAMASFRTPVIALMPDITPSRFRSQANGIINFMGGLGALLVYFGGKPLFDRRVSLPFFVGGVAMFAASMLVVLFISEPRLEETSAGRAEERWEIRPASWRPTCGTCSRGSAACCSSCSPSCAGSSVSTRSRLSSRAMPSSTSGSRKAAAPSSWVSSP